MLGHGSWVLKPKENMSYCCSISLLIGGSTTRSHWGFRVRRFQFLTSTFTECNPTITGSRDSTDLPLSKRLCYFSVISEFPRIAFCLLFETTLPRHSSQACTFCPYAFAPLLVNLRKSLFCWAHWAASDHCLSSIQYPEVQVLLCLFTCQQDQAWPHVAKGCHTPQKTVVPKAVTSLFC